MSDNQGDNNGNGNPSTEREWQLQTQIAGNPVADEAAERIAQEGLALGTYISSRTFMSAEEIAQRLAGLPKGAGFALGTVAGYVTGYERRESTLPVKPGQTKAPPSIWLRGAFEAVSYATGEVYSASAWIVPKIMGEAIEDALQQGDKAVIDIELGVEQSGKLIPPYYYTVRTFIANQAQAAVSTIRMRQQKRMAARGMAAIGKSAEVKALAHEMADQLKADQKVIRDHNDKRKGGK